MLVLAVLVPWDAITTARPARGTKDGRSVQVVGERLYVVATSQYAVELVLTRPLTVRLPRGDARGDLGPPLRRRPGGPS
ncbi:MAG: hypothetical protein GEV07_30335 [Streptosporangiales bacterium]|nr:hypothetical protein [Streptosporangiales bacterium]